MQILIDTEKLYDLMIAAADEAITHLGEWDGDDNFKIKGRKLSEGALMKKVRVAVSRAANEQMYDLHKLFADYDDHGHYDG